ncbi:DNA-directed RNA polymerase II subunit RPB1 [Platanthera guangdongensis]|uniref:DNA-directed RNA polymerase subunit n=1 Tax=Platanthera guangdongensis TaxID=2320717 RepID=A0ABR2MJU2_9ASPA
MKWETCMANMAECSGHFRHLELDKPMFHIGFLEMVLAIMRCVCFNCSKILANEYARPDWMILQVLLIPPPPVRPSVMMETSSRSENGLTHQLSMIIRHKENLRRQERNGAPAHIITEFAQLLQFHIATYFDNELPGQPRATQRSGKSINSICSRLKAKEGQIRGNLMGKQVDFTARTVITPDPTINIDMLGVPLKELVEYGPHPPPGKTVQVLAISTESSSSKNSEEEPHDPNLSRSIEVTRRDTNAQVSISSEPAIRTQVSGTLSKEIPAYIMEIPLAEVAEKVAEDILIKISAAIEETSQMDATVEGEIH